jgi:CBS domain-containing membrane protein
MKMENVANWLVLLTGIDLEKTSHRERIISAVGGFLGIGGILLVSTSMLPASSAGLIVASMGASAVLLFAVPHGKLSQPWALIGGHLISACIGVTVAKWIPHTTLAAAVAVGLAIGAMHYARCIHPPGGASALAAVVSGSKVHALGYMYVLTPVMLNVAIILLVAIVVNFPFYWRMYPAGLKMLMKKFKSSEPLELREQPGIQLSDIRHAIEQMDIVVDVTDDDLKEIFRRARVHAGEGHLSSAQIQLGKSYSNGDYGDDWSVRQVLDESTQPGRDQVIYRVLAGKDRRSTGVCAREEFAHWAKYEVFRNENSWQRVDA